MAQKNCFLSNIPLLKFIKKQNGFVSLGELAKFPQSSIRRLEVMFPLRKFIYTENKFRDIRKNAKVYLQYEFVTQTWFKKKTTLKISGGRRKVNYVIKSRQCMTWGPYVKNILYFPLIRMPSYEKVKCSRKGVGFFSC